MCKSKRFSNCGQRKLEFRKLMNNLCKKNKIFFFSPKNVILEENEKINNAGVKLKLILERI